MNKPKANAPPKRAPKAKRAVRERGVVYTTQTGDADNAPQTKGKPKKMSELRDGQVYEYYPLGRFVVVAPKIAGMKPIFKYTRVRVKRALDMIADGASIDEVAQKLDNAFIPPDAVREALELARKAFVKAHPPLRRVKRWV